MPSTTHRTAPAFEQIHHCEDKSGSLVTHAVRRHNMLCRKHLDVVKWLCVYKSLICIHIIASASSVYLAECRIRREFLKWEISLTSAPSSIVAFIFTVMFYFGLVIAKDEVCPVWESVVAAAVCSCVEASHRPLERAMLSIKPPDPLTSQAMTSARAIKKKSVFSSYCVFVFVFFPWLPPWNL